jgi:predicted phage terminase large subunit-like protein
VPNTLPLVISVDPARSTSSGSSYSVIQVWVQFWGEHISIQQFRDRVSFQNLRDILFRICRTHQPSVVLIEDNSNAAGLALRLRPSDFNVELVSIGVKNKLERLEPHISLIRNGGINVDNTIVDREAFIAELVEFPSAEFDDQVDALTQYLDYVTTHDVPPRRKRAICAIKKSRGPFYC